MESCGLLTELKLEFVDRSQLWDLSLAEISGMDYSYFGFLREELIILILC